MNDRDKIPITDSIQELARFWDTHDLTDFEEELDEVSSPVFEGRRSVIIPLSNAEVAAIEQFLSTTG